MTRDEVLKEFGTDELVRLLPPIFAEYVQSLADEIVRLRDKNVGLNNTVIALSEESRMMRKEFSEVRAERDTYKRRYMAFADMPSTPSDISETEPSAAAGLTDRVIDILNNTTKNTEPLPPIREVMDTMMEHIDEKMTRLQMYHRVIDEIATALGYRMGDAFEPETLVKEVKQLKAVFVAAKTWKASLDTPTALAAADVWDDDTAPEYRDACATLSAAIAYAELAKENRTAMAALAAAEAERDMVIAACRGTQMDTGGIRAVKELTTRTIKAESILAKLREPDWSLLDEAISEANWRYEADARCSFTAKERERRMYYEAIRAAVAAAEKEVGNDPR